MRAHRRRPDLRVAGAAGPARTALAVAVHRSLRYVEWLKSACWQLVLQKPKHFRDAVEISIAGKPDKRRRDLDNVASKAMLDLLNSAPCLPSLPQIFHQRVLSMTFWKTFNGGNDTVSELAIELWRLKAKCVERRIGTPAFPGLGLCH